MKSGSKANIAQVNDENAVLTFATKRVAVDKN